MGVGGRLKRGKKKGGKKKNGKEDSFGAFI